VEVGLVGGGLSGRAKAASISKRAVTAGEGSSRLGILSGLPSLSLLDMLHDRRSKARNKIKRKPYTLFSNNDK
jgi:hypothetical protein